MPRPAAAANRENPKRGTDEFNRRNEAAVFVCGSAHTWLLVVDGCSRGAKTPPAPGEEWADDLRSRINRHIRDPQKKSLLMNLVDQDVEIFKELAQATVTDSDKLLAVDKNYQASQEDCRAVFADYKRTRYRMRVPSTDIRS